MRLIALAFAILAIVPQALKWMAYGLARMNSCTLPARECLVGDNDQSKILNMLWGPSFWTTTGLWIGGAGLVLCIIVMKVLSIIDDRKSQAAMDRADRRAGVGHGSRGPGSTPRGHDRGNDRETEGRMPRPPAFDRYGRPRD